MSCQHVNTLQNKQVNGVFDIGLTTWMESEGANLPLFKPSWKPLVVKVRERFLKNCVKHSDILHSGRTTKLTELVRTCPIWMTDYWHPNGTQFSSWYPTDLIWYPVWGPRAPGPPTIANRITNALVTSIRGRFLTPLGDHQLLTSIDRRKWANWGNERKALMIYDACTYVTTATTSIYIYLLLLYIYIL